MGGPKEPDEDDTVNWKKVKENYDSQGGKTKPKGPGLMKALFGPVDSGPVQFGPKADRKKIRKATDKMKRDNPNAYKPGVKSPDMRADELEKSYDENQKRSKK